MSKPSLLLLLIGLVVLTSCAKTSEEWSSGIEHVIVIGVDGLSPDGIKNATTPVIDSLIAHGAIKRNVRTVLTSSSSQNWASMIMGAGPEQHGVINNDWEIDDHMLPPIVKERSEEHTSELQSRENLVCRLLLEKKKKYM